MISISKDDLEGYNKVWHELLKRKVKILYDIALLKKVSFDDLINEFLPEATQYKDIWSQDYIMDLSNKPSIKNIHDKNPPRKKIYIKKKQKKTKTLTIKIKKCI